MNSKQRLVLYYPHRVDERGGARASKHLLPLSLLTIAGWPDRDGYEVVIVDGNLYPVEEAHRRVVEACEGALLFATTAILSFQVADALHATRAVKARHPQLACFIGGWFPTAAPELELATGLYDAVALGQGEITFRELVRAVDAGEPLESVAGLALWRDGAVAFTPPRAVVGFDQLLDCPWHLLDFEPYRRAQKGEFAARAEDAMPPPPGLLAGGDFVGINYFSSYGCPLDCAFCCSPEATSRRWKAMPAARMLDDLQGLQERWGVQAVFFHDANWSVGEHRIREYADGLIERGMQLATYAFVQTEHVLRFAPETWDRLAESGMYSAILGAESGDTGTLSAVNKPMGVDDNVRAAIELDRRGITPRATYVIGFPGESEAAMLATIDQARQMASASPYAAPSVFPYQPIPGSALWQPSLDAGYQPPRTLEEWGAFGHYQHERAWPERFSPRVLRQRALLDHFMTLANGAAGGRYGWFARHARARLADARGFARGWPGGKLEARSFHLVQKIGRRLPGAQRRERALERGWKSDRTERAPAW